MTHSTWFVPLAGSPAANRRLFAFPYSGGSAHSYQHWRTWLSPQVELLGVQLPGRGTRMGEAPLTSMDRLVDGIVGAIGPLLDKPYQMFGHSNGALMAFAVLNRLLAAGHPPPQAIVLSAKRSPTVRRDEDEEKSSTLPDERFLQKLRDLGGTPQELLDHPELMQVFSPIIRADFALGENFELGQVHPGVAAIPALLFAGQGDLMPVEDVFAWSELLPRSSLVTLNGRHFCINTDPLFPATLTDFLNTAGMAGMPPAAAMLR